MSDTVEVRVWVKTDKVGSSDDMVLEFEREDWAGMTEDEKEQECFNAALEMIEWDFHEKNEFPADSNDDGLPQIQPPFPKNYFPVA